MKAEDQPVCEAPDYQSRIVVARELVHQLIAECKEKIAVKLAEIDRLNRRVANFESLLESLEPQDD